ncbi:unnamed protein product [Gongylonema pulchrum]|uniref:DNA replication licensing factor MCM3 n=1 Tax=Gongylonema pulchrum TaxID=637853 RepID=A0A183DP60_9BILA|nr:unnamed protein product [Gongylonema pulchrum]
MDMISREDENRAREITLEYLNFLDDSGAEKVYMQKFEEMIKDNGSRVVINLVDLRKKLPERAFSLLKNFVPEILCLQQAAKDYVSRLDPQYGKSCDVSVGFEGTFGDRHVNPRTLKSYFLGNMVCCEGIVTKCSALRPKVIRSVHYCPATKKTFERRYTDLTSYEAFPSSNVYPTEDENKNPLETEYGLCTYRDHQTFSMQELPEDAPPGQLPRTVDIVADDDLADSCKPGDRVRVIGLYRCLPNKQNGYSSGSFRSIIISNNVQLLSKEMQPNFLPADIKNIRKMSRQRNIFDLLARSLAPSICGHDEVKKAILCLLLGGNEKVLQNGSHIRGDINILLIGDPSVAKSQLLRYVLHTAPRAIATTGRGSSGVGLTAAVTTDIDTGERRLEAGAMVLADRGIMSDIDRTAIHEVMEQGRDSLLSRFDLIFVLMDEHDAERDNKVAEHILKLHQYRTPGEADGAVLPMGTAVESLTSFDADEEVTMTEVCEKNKDWCAVKERFVFGIPKLTEAASSYISECYAELRSFDTSKTDRERTMPVTVRQLETLIRLATAMAKARLGKNVERSDARKAFQLLHYACFKEKPKERLELEEKRGRRARGSDSEESDEDEEAEDLEVFSFFFFILIFRRGDDTQISGVAASDATTARLGEESMDVDFDESLPGPSAKRPRRETPSINIDRYKTFRRYLRKAFDDLGNPDDMIDLSVIRDAIQAQAGRLLFSESEFEAAFEQATSENIAMIADNRITLI